MKVKLHRTVQKTMYFTYRKLNTSRDTLSSLDPCWRQKLQIDGVLFVRMSKNNGVLFVRGKICP